MPHTEAQKRASRIARGLPATKPRSVGHSRAHENNSSATAKKQFVAWDGEGVTDDDGTHRYTLFANSNRDYVESSSLTTLLCLEHLLRSVYDTGTVHVIFGGSYDISMWIRDLPKDTIARILSADDERGVRFTIGSNEYCIQYRPRKSFKLGRVNQAQPWVKRAGKWRVNYEAKITIWEVFGFFQSSFVKACESYGVTVWEKMSAFKESRATFRDDQAQQIREYCFQECEQLTRLMETLQDNLHSAGLYPTRWDGAGAVAAALLRREAVKDHIAAEPKHLVVPVACAFFGGRIEICKVGRAKRPVLNYDIASAYPAAAQDLPSLHGKWVPDRFPRDAASFTLSYVEWNFPAGEPWYPLPYRDAGDGTIVFSRKGSGWYWQPEYLAARDWAMARGFRNTMRRCATWTLIPDLPMVKPFGFIPELSRKRQEYKADGNGAEKALKLALNSLYGKTAQQVGARDGKPPPYFALPWAGWITATTRARLVRAAMTDPHAIIAFATDGIYSTRALPLETCKGVLGAWESATTSEDAVFVAAGIYWTRDDGKWKSRYRGFDREAMKEPDFVLAAWKNGLLEVSVPSTRFVTHKSAIRSEMLWKEVCRWRTIGRALCLTGHSPKREPIVPAARGEWAAHSRLVPLRPRAFAAHEERQGCSAPYATFRLAEIDGTDERTYDEEHEEANL